MPEHAQPKPVNQQPTKEQPPADVPAKKSHKKLGVVLGIVTVLMIVTVTLMTLAVIVLLPLLHTPSDTNVEIGVIKSSYAEMDVAVQKSQAGASAGEVQSDALFGQQAISANFPNTILPYASAVFNWGGQIQTSAVNNTLSSVAQSPQSYQLSLSNQDATDSYTQSLAAIERLRQFGDYALAKNSQDTMRWVAARLSAEQNYLDALANVTTISQAPGNIAYATTYGAQCYVGRAGAVFYSNRTNRNACAKQLGDQIKPAIGAAKNFARTGKAADAKDWNVTWGALKAQGYPITTTGATVGNDQPQPPPAMQAFRNACDQNGGTTPAGGAKDGLPTTESGQTCRYKGPQGGTCWTFQTDSGADYAGGDPDCPRQNVLPPTAARNNAVQQQTPAQPPPNPYPWDGSYTTTASLSCNPPDNGHSASTLASAFGDHFVVEKGQVFYLSHTLAGPTIDAKTGDGKGAVSTAGVTYDFSFHFAAAGDSVNVNGARNISGRVSCSGSFSGQKGAQ